jgi:hypothetical protein
MVPSEARHPRDGAAPAPEPRSSAPRPLHAWNVLDRDRRLAAVAALALFLTMLLPWYQQNAVVSTAKRGALLSQNLNAFAVFSFIEAAILLVALAVLFLLYKRAEGASFHLPGSDGAVIFAAGLWAALLLVLRLFDKPGITHNGVAANVGVQWGIFFALAAAGLLAYSGSRMRGARRPEPPLLRREPRAPRHAAPSTAATATPSAPPASEEETAILARRGAGEEDETTVLAAPRSAGAPATPAASAAPTSRSRYPPAPASAKPRRDAPPPEGMDQLSFEDQPYADE